MITAVETIQVTNTPNKLSLMTPMLLIKLTVGEIKKIGMTPKSKSAVGGSLCPWNRQQCPMGGQAGSYASDAGIEAQLYLFRDGCAGIPPSSVLFRIV